MGDGRLEREAVGRACWSLSYAAEIAAVPLALSVWLRLVFFSHPCLLLTLLWSKNPPPPKKKTVE